MQGEREREIVSNIEAQKAKLKEDRQPFEDAWTDVAQHLTPFVVDFKNPQKPKLEYSTKIFDGKSITAARLLANGLSSNIFPRGAPWFRLAVEDDDLMKVQGIKMWLEQLEGVFYDTFNRSNFYDTFNVALEQASKYGTVAIAVQEDFENKRLMYTLLGEGTFFLAENEFGEVDTLYRELWMSRRNVWKKFGKANLPETFERYMDNGPHEEVCLVHAVYPNDEYDMTSVDNQKFKYKSCWVLRDESHLCRESGFKQFPYVVYRWKKTPRFAYGLGPGIEALRDAKMLNMATKSMIEVAQTEAKPPMMVSAELKNSFEDFPGGRNYVTNPQGAATPARTTGNYSIGIDREERLRRAIEEHFDVDFFLMLQRATRQMTAQEVMARQNEQAAVIGATSGRINSELIEPSFDITYQFIVERGLLPPLSLDLQQLTQGRAINIDFIGPMAQAQKRAAKTQGVMNGLSAVIPLLQIDPTIADNFDFDVTARLLGEESGMPSAAIRDERERDMMRKQRAEAQMAQMAQMQQAAQMETAAKTLPKLNEPLNPDSMAASMMGGGR